LEGTYDVGTRIDNDETYNKTLEMATKWDFNPTLVTKAGSNVDDRVYDTTKIGSVPDVGKVVSYNGELFKVVGTPEQGFYGQKLKIINLKDGREAYIEMKLRHPHPEWEGEHRYNEVPLSEFIPFTDITYSK
jgi:hypothetical protein